MLYKSASDGVREKSATLSIFSERFSNPLRIGARGRSYRGSAVRQKQKFNPINSMKSTGHLRRRTMGTAPAMVADLEAGNQSHRLYRAMQIK